MNQGIKAKQNLKLKKITLKSQNPYNNSKTNQPKEVKLP